MEDTPLTNQDPINKEIQIITKDMILGEVVFNYPHLGQVLLDYGLHCVGCFANVFDTVEGGAKVHGMSDEEIDEMVDALNEALNEKSS